MTAGGGAGEGDALVRAFGRTLVVAPHPDDEVLGAGGTIARLARGGGWVGVAIVTTGRPPRFASEGVGRVRREAEEAHGTLGVAETLWLGLPAAELCEVPHADLNAALADAFARTAPDTILVPHPGDIHRDHGEVFTAALVAARPAGPVHPRRILAYETLSETNWNAPYLTPAFQPQVHVDIAHTLGAKVEAMACFASQIRQFPNERSIEAIRALATLRGAGVHLPAAEGFVSVREVL